MTTVDWRGQQLDLLDAARAARDEGLARCDANASDWDRRVVDQAILTAAETGRPFSANDFRDRLPEITNRNLIGTRIRAMAQQKVPPYSRIGEVISTDAGTHAKKIGLYQKELPA